MVEVYPLKAFRDNYIWTLRNGSRVAVVDPGDATPVLEHLERERLELVAVLATHHHADHVGGIPEIVRVHAVPVYGPRDEPISTVTRPVTGGDRVELPSLGLSFDVLDIPGHTRAHVAYYGRNALFCGDTLFACGCGRVFEGTPAQMHASLAKLADLPDDTLVFCGHEYTMANIDFAMMVEPENPELERLRDEVAALRAEGRPTLPTTIGRERTTNPFLRCEQPDVVAAADRYLGKPAGRPAKVFEAIRDWKNRT